MIKRPFKSKLGSGPCSAPDIHLGHMVVMRKLREFQETAKRILLSVTLQE